MMRVNDGSVKKCWFLLVVIVMVMLLPSCGNDEELLRPKVNKYDLFKEEHPATVDSKGLLSEAAATEKSTLVVKVNRLVLVDSSLKRGGSQYLYSAGAVMTIIKTTGRDSVVNNLMFISHTRFDVNVSEASPVTLFLDSIAVASPLRASGVKYKWLNKAPLK